MSCGSGSCMKIRSKPLSLKGCYSSWSNCMCTMNLGIVTYTGSAVHFFSPQRVTKEKRLLQKGIKNLFIVLCMLSFCGLLSLLCLTKWLILDFIKENESASMTTFRTGFLGRLQTFLFILLITYDYQSNTVMD